MIYLINGELITSYYMANTQETKVTRIVIADSEPEAIEKFVHHFERLSDDFSPKYTATVDSIHKAIS